MSFNLVNIWQTRSRDVAGVNVYSSTTSEYSALIMLNSMQISGRQVSFAAVYGAFDETVIGGSANFPTPTSFPDISKPIVYYKGDAEGQAYFSNPEGPPLCASFTHIILVFDIKDQQVLIPGKNGVAHTISLAEATNLTMEDVSKPELWCKTASIPLATSASVRSTSSNTVSAWVIGISIGVLALLILIFARRNYKF